ncbi:MAG: hypothetical protein ACYS9X_11865 [Planctomycetota bacterium]|jgi:hypothetical protein
MPWRVEINRELGCIHTVYTGTVTKQDAIDATAEALSLAKEGRRNLFLSDFLNADPHISTLDIYDIPSEWGSAGANRANRLALVVPEGGRLWKDARFYESTCRNQGWNVRIFSCRQRAVDWLTDQGSFNRPDAGNG